METEHLGEPSGVTGDRQHRAAPLPQGRRAGDLVKPGEPVPGTLTLYPTSNLFMPGHRIRLDVSSSNFPRFDVNPNTGEAIGRERRRVVADNTVFHERGRESRVVLPIVPT
ncbi:MAG TPA: CocE/NonD family hydrolase [Candidatus Limnocylindrales bacterium]|nr:CocE/NonD family hydrolase [Candidatus Limnocylindrales bacterium]